MSFAHRRQVSHLLLASALVVLASGCAAGLGSTTYPRGQARTVQSVQKGTVASVREVTIEGTRSGVGRVAGGVIGGVAGSRVGGGDVRILTGAVGAVVGVVAGEAAEEALTRQRGLEIMVDLDNGRTVSIVQAADVSFSVGDRVRVLEGPGPGAARVAY